MNGYHVAVAVAVLVYVALCLLMVRAERRHGSRCECTRCVRRRAIDALERVHENDDRASVGASPVVALPDSRKEVR